MQRFIFGRGPEESGLENEYVLMEREAAEKAAQAFQCRTWAEYAELLGMTWEQAQEAWTFDEDEAEGEEVPGPDDAFDYEEIVAEESYLSLPDPRQVAYELLVRRIPWKDDPVLASTFEISHGSPAGHLECISANRREGLERLAEIINDSLAGEATLDEDEVLISAALGFRSRAA